MTEFDKIIFKDKTFSGLLEDIYNKSAEREIQLKTVIGDIRNYITSLQDMVMLSPVIKDMLEISVKNDDQLVKMAAVIQRAMSRTVVGDVGSMIFTEDEIEEMKSIAESNSEKMSTLKKSKSTRVPLDDLEDIIKET